MLVECEQFSRSEGSHTGNRRNDEERSREKLLSNQLLLGSFGPQTNDRWCRLVLTDAVRLSVTLNTIITDLTLGWN